MPILTDDEAIVLHRKLADYHADLASTAILDNVRDCHTTLAEGLRQEGEIGIGLRGSDELSHWYASLRTCPSCQATTFSTEDVATDSAGNPSRK